MAPGPSLRIFVRVRRAKAVTAGSYLSRKESSCDCGSACESSVFLPTVDDFALTIASSFCNVIPSLREAKARNLFSSATSEQQVPPFGRNDKSLRGTGRGPPAEARSPLHSLLRPLIFRPLIHPIVHGFVPELRILRLQHPVAFVGEIQHL